MGLLNVLGGMSGGYNEAASEKRLLEEQRRRDEEQQRMNILRIIAGLPPDVARGMDLSSIVNGGDLSSVAALIQKGKEQSATQQQAQADKVRREGMFKQRNKTEEDRMAARIMADAQRRGLSDFSMDDAREYVTGGPDAIGALDERIKALPKDKEEPVKGMNIGGKLVNPVTGELIADYSEPSKDPNEARNSKLAGQNAIAQELATKLDDPNIAENFGPARGRIEGAKSWITGGGSMSPEMTDFVGKLYNLVDLHLRERSGAAVPPEEVDRVMTRVLGGIETDPKTLQTRLKAFIDVNNTLMSQGMATGATDAERAKNAVAELESAMRGVGGSQDRKDESLTPEEQDELRRLEEELGMGGGQ